MTACHVSARSQDLTCFRPRALNIIDSKGDLDILPKFLLSLPEVRSPSLVQVRTQARLRLVSGDTSDFFTPFLSPLLIWPVAARYIRTACCPGFAYRFRSECCEGPDLRGYLGFSR